MKIVHLPTAKGGVRLEPRTDATSPLGDQDDTSKPPAVTPMQEAMRLHALTNPGMELQQVVMESDERLNWDRLVAAWRWVLERHPGLRVVFDTSDPSCTRQRVLSLGSDELPARVSIERRAQLKSFLQRDREAPRPTDRRFGGVTLLNAPDGDILVWTHHHANVDGRSIALVMSDLLRRYDQGAAYEPPREGDLVQVLRARAALNADAAVDYFVERLQGVDEATPTPGALAHTGDEQGTTVESHASLDAVTLGALRALGKEHGFTFANAVQLAWALIISRYTFRDDVVVGVTRSGRFAVDGAKGVVGCLINTIPLRVRLKPDTDCLSALRGLREEVLATRPHETVPLAQVRTRLGLEAGLLDTVIVHEGHTLQLRMRQLLGEAVVGRTFAIHSRSAPGLVLALKEDEDRPIVVKVEYREDKVAKYVADSLPERLTSVLRQFVEHPERLLSNVFVADLDESSPLRSRVPAGPQAPSLAEGLRAVVSARPQNAAIVELSTGLRLSYAELLDAVSAFSRRLHSLGVKPGDVVAVSARASAETVVAFWGCAFVGAVYLPIDPTYPSDRREHMLEDSGARLVALSAEEPQWAGDAFDYVVIPTRGDEQPLFEPLKVGLDAPLYLIYTSGSSGTPKGVVVSTRALLQHAAAARTKYGLAHYDSVIQFASPSFDVWFEEVVPTALIGAALVVRDEMCARSIDHLLERVREHRISVLQLPTAFFNEVVAEMTRSGGRLPAVVRLVIIGGERANAAACARFSEAHPEVRLVNAYGPTETTITALAYGMQGEKRVHGEVPIGRPLGGTLAWVVDTCGNPAPRGGIGELVLGGPQLAIGYHRRPEQTEAAFPKDLGTLGATRTYRTGDLVLANEDSELVYVGRADEQVKLRGYRIELGEIESALRNLAGVAEGVVVFHEGAKKEARLVAWVVPTEGADERTVKTELGARLPHYMVPSDVCFVEHLPVTPGGKIDRRELSRRIPPRVDSVQSDEDVAASPLVAQLAELFGAVVARAVGPDDDFFDMGGHSLRVIRLVGEIRESMGFDVGAGAVFAARTPRRLAERMQAQASPGAGSPAAEFVELNAGRSGVAPMYCILGIDVYRPIAERMGPRPVVGVYVPEEELGHDGKMPSTEELASAYLGAVATPAIGPARSVCGVSYGAVVALELAQQRAAAGDPLDLLVLLDPVLPEMETEGRWDPIHNLVHRVRYQGEELGQRALRRLGLLPNTVVPRAGAPDGEADRLAWVERRDRYSVALQDYAHRLRPYSGRSVVFIARDRRPTTLNDTIKRWRELLGPYARVEVMPGNHGTFISPPYVDQLAERLTNLLDHSMQD
ncbi:MAG: amino acid adenylation domain-containing protein [Polyangiales bacterium]